MVEKKVSKETKPEEAPVEQDPMEAAEALVRTVFRQADQKLLEKIVDGKAGKP